MKTHVVLIVGGGFAGLNAAKVLAHKPNVRVVLVDQRNHHLFQPLLYQVATAGLNPADIAVPIRAQFSKAENVQIHLAKIETIDLEKRLVLGREISFHFDYLILACGAQHSYFAHPEWEPLAPGLKTLEQATEMRKRILLAFEQAENEVDPERQKQFLTFIVIGAGPTGVELAGAIADISRTVLVRDFKRIHPENAKVFLIEAGDRVLASFAEELSLKAQQDLEKMGVTVMTRSRVQQIDTDGVNIGTERILGKTVFWAAGVQATKIQLNPNVDRDKNDRIKTEKDFSLPHYPDVFVVGDLASYDMGQGQYLPGLAPAAIQSGRYVAKVILSSIRGTPRSAFYYKDKGQMATIGKNKAIAQMGNFRMNGRAAWLAWLFVHILYLIGFKNRIMVLFEWAWSYLFSKRGARLITGDTNKDF